MLILRLLTVTNYFQNAQYWESDYIALLNRSPTAGASEKHYYHLPNESRAQIGRLFETKSSFAPQKVRRQSFGKCLGLFIAQAVFCLLFFKKVSERNADKLLIMKQNIYQ